MRCLKPGSLALVMLTAALVASLTGESDAVADDRRSLGSVDFPNSCDPAARGELEDAVALLHHMTYQQALSAFEGVAAREPGCAMAHWGIAMSLFQPLWPNRPGPAELSRGLEASERAVAAHPPTERERLYAAAAAAFFRGDQSTAYWDRIRAWETAQAVLYDAFPDDHDAAAFYALAHLASAPLAERPAAHYARSAQILLEVLRHEASHPGAVHYTIHANDIAGRESESLDVVRSYGEIAPHNPHALHMPTHIFVRLGSWQEVIDWNRRAAEAALAHPAGEHGEYVWDEFPHALEYLVYAALQQGRNDIALEAWERLRRTDGLQPTFKTAFHLASIPARLVLERHDWAEAARLEPRAPGWIEWELFPWPEAVSWFARGLGSARGGDLDSARVAAASLDRLRGVAAKRGEEPFARQIEILQMELEAWVAFGEGDVTGAVDRLESAIELERATPKHPVTPGATLPAEELLGDLLLESGRPELALTAYQSVLRTSPGRRNSLLGVERATRALQH